MSRARKRPAKQTTGAERPENDGGDYEVEQVLDSRDLAAGKRYLIRWSGFAADYDSWEPRANLDNVAELIADFESRREKEMAVSSSPTKRTRSASRGRKANTKTPAGGAKRSGSKARSASRGRGVAKQKEKAAMSEEIVKTTRLRRSVSRGRPAAGNSKSTTKKSPKVKVSDSSSPAKRNSEKKANLDAVTSRLMRFRKDESSAGITPPRYSVRSTTEVSSTTWRGEESSVRLLRQRPRFGSSPPAAVESNRQRQPAVLVAQKLAQHRSLLLWILSALLVLPILAALFFYKEAVASWFVKVRKDTAVHKP